MTETMKESSRCHVGVRVFQEKTRIDKNRQDWYGHALYWKTYAFLRHTSPDSRPPTRDITDQVSYPSSKLPRYSVT